MAENRAEAREAELERPLILSASRTRDMVHRSPDILAAALSGRHRVRWGPYAPEGRVDPSRLRAVVLWTKAPANLLYHTALRETLERLATVRGVVITLQLTVTGLGGSFVEPGIPNWRHVASVTQQVLEQPWLGPRAVTLRFDPLVVVETPGRHVLGNLEPAVSRTVLEPFLDMGIRRVVASRGDAVHYPRVAERVSSIGLRWIPIADAVAARVCRLLDSWCAGRGATFSVCCDPPVPDLVHRWGCVDADHINSLAPGAEPATRWLHNRLGKQRPACRCTYSKDIGYTTGVARCFSGGFGCLYCYAQGRSRVPHAGRLRQEIVEFDANPEGYLGRRGLPEALAMPLEVVEPGGSKR